jgi:hypothetical protein
VSIDAGDLVDNSLNEQARVNSAIDTGDVNNLVADFAVLGSGEPIGFQADALATATSTPPHLWDDGQSFWGTCTWP